MNLEQLKKENRERFRKEFWKLRGGSPGELDKKQDDYVDQLTTTSYQAGKDEAVEIAKQATPQSVDDYVAIIKAGNWDKMYDLGKDTVIKALQDNK